MSDVLFSVVIPAYQAEKRTRESAFASAALYAGLDCVDAWMDAIAGATRTDVTVDESRAARFDLSRQRDLLVPMFKGDGVAL